MSAQKKDSARFTEIRNSKALREYFVEEKFEAGIALKGTEVKSFRAGKVQINDAFGRFEKGELWPCASGAAKRTGKSGGCNGVPDERLLDGVILECATCRRSRGQSS